MSLMNLIPGFSPLGWSIVAMGVMALIFTGYFFYAQNKIEDMQVEITSLKVSNTALKGEVKNLKVDMAQQQLINKELVDAERAAVKASDALQKKLAKLDGAAEKKPALVEKLINNASKERARCFELATGAVVKKGEKNSVCPQFIK